MNLKWLLFLFPITAFITTFLSRSQNVEMPPGTESSSHFNIQKAEPDSIKVTAPAYSMMELYNTEPSPLPGQMPLYPAPDVDSNMIVPMNINSEDTTRAPEKPY